MSNPLDNLCGPGKQLIMAPNCKNSAKSSDTVPQSAAKALEQSAKQAQRLADAFGVTVPSIKPKPASSSHNAR